MKLMNAEHLKPCVFLRWCIPGRALVGRVKPGFTNAFKEGDATLVR
jgi:hypothetical protein